jgi:poly(hydroxyalkanoate) depolymerase family esterase
VGFAPNPGGLHMLAHVPAVLPPAAALVVLLHGCGQSAADHAEAAGWLDLADRLGFVVLAPEQTMVNNLNRCFNWHRPADTDRNSGEAASIMAMVDSVLASRDVDPRRVFIAGLSAGGAMTMAMLMSFPERFEAGAVIAGVPFGLASNLIEAMGVMRHADIVAARRVGRAARDRLDGVRVPRLAIWQGAADEVVDPANAMAIAAQWAEVSGLPGVADETDLAPGLTRRRWTDKAGQAAIEYNLVAGLGHGTPLATIGSDGLGTIGPFMLEAGVSAAREIGRFWGIEARATTARTRAAPPTAETLPPAAAQRSPLPGRDRRVGGRLRAAVTKGLKALGIGR